MNLGRETSKKRPTYPLTLDAADIPFMQRILGISQAVLFSDTKHEPDWHTFTGHTYLRSWLWSPWWPPNTPSVFSRSATTSPTALHEKTSAVRNFWQSPLQSLFKILVFMNAPRSMDPNLKNASMISTQQKKPWNNQKKAERFRRTSSRKSSGQVRSLSLSQPSVKGVFWMSIPLSRNATVILGRT
jgi:hypothetical protein